ncbi:MAG: hypothetical protein H0X03_07125 [Nitrosopumilus sp.]|nr:hypothetical protein [Nitrosopumilus sp.]
MHIEACNRTAYINDKFNLNNSNLKVKEKDTMVNNKLLRIDPNSKEKVLLTYKAMIRYNQLPEEQWR